MPSHPRKKKQKKRRTRVSEALDFFTPPLIPFPPAVENACKDRELVKN